MANELSNTDFDISDDDLLAMERRMLDAFDARSIDDLNALGFGELGVPVAWPDAEPRLCVKRLISSSDTEIESLLADIAAYIAALEPHVSIVPTQLRTVVNDHDRTVGYLVQPLLPAEHLLENVLPQTTPEVGHPAILAVRGAIVNSVADQVATLDSQLSNFTWHEGDLGFFDIGTPFMLVDGQARPITGAAMKPMPAVLRPVATKEAARIANEFATVRGNLEHAAISVARLGLDDWLDPVVETFNQVIDEPLEAEEIKARLAKRHKDMIMLKRLMKVQRTWATKIRRQPYDFFITDSFSGKIL
ncbi:MAG: DUF6206 family protein [Actinomycetota bacterium]